MERNCATSREACVYRVRHKVRRGRGSDGKKENLSYLFYPPKMKSPIRTQISGHVIFKPRLQAAPLNNQNSLIILSIKAI